MFVFNPSPFITNVKGKEVVAKKADRQRWEELCPRLLLLHHNGLSANWNLFGLASTASIHTILNWSKMFKKSFSRNLTEKRDLKSRQKFTIFDGEIFSKIARFWRENWIFTLKIQICIQFFAAKIQNWSESKIEFFGLKLNWEQCASISSGKWGTLNKKNWRT